MSEKLQDLLAELHAERVRSWPAEDVSANIEQRQELVDRFDPAQLPAVGSALDNFSFSDVTGGDFSLDDLVQRGPAVLIVFRFAGCPACNIALPYYQRNLWPQLSKLNIPLVAISPQTPERLGDIRTRHDLGFTVASDRDNRFSNYLGTTYAPNAAATAYMARKSIVLRDTIGGSDEQLPQTTVLVIDKNRVLRFIDVAPDWLARTEAPTILETIGALIAEPA